MTDKGCYQLMTEAMFEALYAAAVPDGGDVVIRLADISRYEHPKWDRERFRVALYERVEPDDFLVCVSNAMLLLKEGLGLNSGMPLSARETAAIRLWRCAEEALQELQKL